MDTGYTHALSNVDACVWTRCVSLSECSRGRPVLFYPHYYSVGDRALIRGRSTARQGKPRGEPRLFMDGFPFNFRQDRSVSLYRFVSLRPDPLLRVLRLSTRLSATLPRAHFNAAPPPTRLIQFESSLSDGGCAIGASCRIFPLITQPASRAFASPFSAFEFSNPTIRLSVINR